MPSSSMILPRARNRSLVNWHLVGHMHRTPSRSLESTKSRYTRTSEKVLPVIRISSTKTETWSEWYRSGPRIFISAFPKSTGDRECPYGKVVGCHCVGSPCMENARIRLHFSDMGMHLNAALMSRVTAYLWFETLLIAVSTSPIFE